MKNYIIKGLKLLVISSLYILVSSIYYNSLYHSEIAMHFGILIGLGFLALWFYFGYHYLLGFKGGLLTGILGALFGICSIILSFTSLLDSPDDASSWIMIPWSYPFLSLFDLFPSIMNIPILNKHGGIYVIYLSVLIVILLTGFGGYIGKKKRTTSN